MKHMFGKYQTGTENELRTSLFSGTSAFKTNSTLDIYGPLYLSLSIS